MKYLLDTNVIIHLANRAEGSDLIEQRLLTATAAKVCISSITSFELMRMLSKGEGRVKKKALEFVSSSLDTFRVLPYNKQDAEMGGFIMADLEKSGTRIGTHDCMIAGQALHRGLVVVTDNTGEFSRVPLLRLENWRKP